MMYKCIGKYGDDFTIGKYYERHKEDTEDYFIDDDGDKRYLLNALDTPGHHFNNFFTKINFVNYLNEIENE